MCLHALTLARSEDDPVPFGDGPDTVQTIVPLLWILLVGLIGLDESVFNLLMRVFLVFLAMEPRLAPLGRPPFLGPIGNNLVFKPREH
jgi:hypothetical protein